MVSQGVAPMAYRKHKLDQATEYQILQATYLSTRLLTAAQSEHNDPFEIALEVQDAEGWDDIAVFSPAETSSGVEHWQIKRQTTPLDEKSLAKLLSSAYTLLQEDDTKTFRFGVPGTSVLEAKPTGRLRGLDELCSLLRAPGILDSQLPDVLPDQVLKDCFGFVQGLTDGDQAGAKLVLSRLGIEELGSPATIKERTNQALEAWYAEPDRARQLIEEALREANPVCRLRFEDLAARLEAVPRVGTSRHWVTFLRYRDQVWHRGTLPTSTSAIVAKLWSESSGGPELRLLARGLHLGPLTPPLLRLALHSSRGTVVSCVDRDGWRRSADSMTGDTLGASDFQSPVDSVFPGDCERSEPSPLPPPSGSATSPETLAKALGEEMEAETWRRVCDSILGELATLGTLAEILRAPWTDLQSLLEKSQGKRCLMFHRALRAAFEPAEIRGDVRCGPMTAVLLARSLLLLVALRSVFSESMTLDETGEFNLSGVPVRALALPTCYDKDQRCIAFLSDHIGKVAYGGGVLVLGGTDTDRLDEDVELQRQGSFASSDAPSFSADQPGADVIIAWSSQARRALRGGEPALREWLQERITKATGDHRESLRATLEAIALEENGGN